MCSLCLSCLEATFNNWLFPCKTLLLWNPPRRLQSIANGSASAAGSHRFPWCGGWFCFMWKRWDPTVCGALDRKKKWWEYTRIHSLFIFPRLLGSIRLLLVLFSRMCGFQVSMRGCSSGRRRFHVFKTAIPATSDHSWPLKLLAFSKLSFEALQWNQVYDLFFPGDIIQWTCS